MMEQLIPVLMIVGMVAFIMVRQIGKITRRLDRAQNVNAFARYSKFSAIIQEHVREIKQSIDQTKDVSVRKYKLLETVNAPQALEELSDMIRKLVFFETMMARQKSSEEIEAELFEILTHLEKFLQSNCQDGETLSDEFL